MEEQITIAVSFTDIPESRDSIRADLQNSDSDQPPELGEIVHLIDSLGNSCDGEVLRSNGHEIDVELDTESWHSPHGQPAPRLKRRKRVNKPEPGGITTGMLNGSPDPECPLCEVWGIPWDPTDPETWKKQHIHAEALWHAWRGAPPKTEWPERVRKVAEELGISASIEQIKRHFKYHRPEQPMMSGPLRRDELIVTTNKMIPRKREVVTALYRQRILTTEQMIEVFYADGRTPNHGGVIARTELAELASKHFVYRYHYEKNKKNKKVAKQFAGGALWLLGKASVPYIEDEYGRKIQRQHFTQRSREVSSETILHDVKANDVFVSLHRAIRERNSKLEVATGETNVGELLPKNWYGPKHLSIEFFDRLSSKRQEIRADGFASLSIHRSSWQPGAFGSCQMPFFYEFDHGTRMVSEVRNQLYAYHLLGLSGAAGQRFPDLAIDGYSVPVVMVFSDRNRLELVQRRFLEKMDKVKPEIVTPILLAFENDWKEDALNADVFVAWDREQRPFKFVDLLKIASRPLIDAGTVPATHTLRIDLDGARRIISTGVRSDTGSADARKQKIAKEMQKKAEDAGITNDLLVVEKDHADTQIEV